MNMLPSKPIFLKTYSRQKTKLSGWMSPDYRKQAFDSSITTDDENEFEPRKTTKNREKKSGLGCKAVRPSKRKAKQCLKENTFNEENDPSLSCFQLVQQTKTSRRKRKPVSTARAARPAKRKATLHLTDTSSEEENIRRPPLRQRKNRKNQLARVPGVTVAEKKTRKLPWISENKENSVQEVQSPHGQKSVLQRTTGSNNHVPPSDRFVTRRMPAGCLRNKVDQGAVSILNSSDKFIAEDTGSTRAQQGQKRKLPPVFKVSSTDNSGHVPGVFSFNATSSSQDLSLNGAANNSLPLCSRKPLFCSTPFAATCKKQPIVKPVSISDTPPSLSICSNNVSGTFSSDLRSPGQATPPPPSLPLFSELSPMGTAHTSMGNQEPSGDLFPETNHEKTCTVEKENGKENQDNVTKRSEGSQSLPCTVDNEGSSDFLSTASDLERLIRTLKETCLNTRCTVQLQRLDDLFMSQLCSQTIYLSCLGQSSSSQLPQVISISTTDCSLSSDAPFHLQLSVSDVKNSCVSLCHESVEFCKRAASVPGGQNSETSVPTLVSTSEKLLSPAAAEPSGELIVGEKSLADTKRGMFISCPIRISGSVTASKRRSRFSSRIEDADAEAEGKAAAPIAKLKQECLRNKLKVEVKRESVLELRKFLQGRSNRAKSHTDVSNCGSDDQLTNCHQSESDTTQSCKETGKSGGLTVSKESSSSDKSESLKGSRKRKKTSRAPQQQQKKRRSTSTDRAASNRKACVSGLSITRWKNKDFGGFITGRPVHSKTGDCSISEMISSKHKQPGELLGTTMTLSTPVRVGRLNLSSLLTDLTPQNTQTWSRLKAALSVHRKGIVLHTPNSSCSAFTPRRVELLDVSKDLFASPFCSSLPNNLRSQLGDCDDNDLSDAEKVYAECNQQHPLPWEECIFPERMKQCVKIGEGTFGEVFSTVDASGNTVALKLIPVEGSDQVNGSDQKTFGEILHEIIISKELSSLKEKKENQTHGFIGLMDLHCVRGCYPSHFLDAWDNFDQQKGSENDRPDFFPKDQLFIILEFEFGGVDLENSNGKLSSLGVAKSILHQVAAALSVAEQELHFEHRDLHWGNVLVRPTKVKKGSFLLNGEVQSLDTKGVLVSIIDYSLSRLAIDDLIVSCDISADEELFMGQGDYQFDIYRIMREKNGNNWNSYHPHTNVLWLHYLCSKLLDMKYRNSGGKAAKETRKMLKHFYESVLKYGSATEALQDSPLFQ